MTNPTRPVRMAVRCWCAPSSTAQPCPVVPITASWEYTAADPWAVHLDVTIGLQHVRWSFAREMLESAIDASVTGPPVGLGDVRLSRERDDLRIELTSPSGHAVLWMRLQRARQFLLRTERRVPAGTEETQIDWSTVIARCGRPRHDVRGDA